MLEVTDVRSPDLTASSEVSESLKTFFLKGMREEKDVEKCEICLEDKSSVGLSGAVLGVVLQALLPQVHLHDDKREKGGSLLLCVKCKSLLITLSDLFLQLEELRCHFNDLRRKVGRQVILGSLGKSESEWAAWENQSKRVETSYASSVPDDGAKKKNEIQEDLKLNKMTPVVLLQRLKETPPTASNLTETLMPQEEIQVKEEDVQIVETQNQNEDAEFNDLWIESELPVKKEPSSSPPEDVPVPRKCQEKPPNAKKHYPCPRCQTVFSTKYDVETHKASVHERPNKLGALLQCSICSRIFRKRIDLLQHEASVHSILPRDTPDLHCTHCELTFPGPFTLKTHQLKEHFLGSTAAGDSQCPFCLEYFPDKSSMLRHRRNLHFRGLPRYQRDLKPDAHLPRNIYCFVCKPKKSFLNQKQLKIHVQSAQHKMNVQYKQNCKTLKPKLGWTAKALQANHKRPPHQKKVINQNSSDPQETAPRIIKVTGSSKPKPTPKETHTTNFVEFWRMKEKLMLLRKAARLKSQDFNPASLSLTNKINTSINPPTAIQVVPQTIVVQASIENLVTSEFSCSHCQLTFPGPFTLKKHKMREHLLGSTAAGDIQCRFCLKLFRSKTSNLRHQRYAHFRGIPIHKRKFIKRGHSPQNINCFICKTDEGFWTYQLLRRHKDSAEHKEKVQSKQSAHCNVCKLNFGLDLEVLNLHLKSDQHQKEVLNPSNSNASSEEVSSFQGEEFKETNCEKLGVESVETQAKADRD